MTHSPEPPSKVDKTVETIRKLLVPGGAIAGVASAWWALGSNDDNAFTKAIVSASLGFALSIGAVLLGPVAKATKRRAAYIGEEFDYVTEQMIASATGFERKYLYCQASACERVRSEGLAQKENTILEPMLRDVFVELQIDEAATVAGYESSRRRRLSVAQPRRETIWNLLAASQQYPQYKRLAILAWGGYGKTTLLKHVAYRYGVGDVPKGVPKLVPMLLVLRKYSKRLLTETPPTLPELINQYHIDSLPEKHQLRQIPPNWANNLLLTGKALVMLDGFDEAPQSERPKVASWLHEQMRLYSKSVFIVTSRPKAYTDQMAADRLQMSVQLWVQPFDQEQRRCFIESWYLCQEKLKARGDTPEVRQVAAVGAGELIEQIEREPDLIKMAKNPLLLNMIATYHRLYPGAELPQRRSELYAEICQLLLRDRPRVRRLATVLLNCDPLPVLAQVAFNMMQRERKQVDGNVRIEKSVLLKELENVLNNNDESVNVLAFLEETRDVSELLVKQEEEYEFAHLSFQEYLAAAYVDAKAEERETLLFSQLDKDWWKGTILLYAGMTKKPVRLINEAMRQGRNDLAYECLQQTTKRVDEALRAELAELQAVTVQVQDARYADLARYLQNGQWKEADNETYRLMITEVGKDEGQWFAPGDFRNFPCEPLRAIDGLWVKHSGGKFGFSVQKEMYLECGGIPDGKYDRDSYEKFLAMNGWMGEIKYGLEAPKGHLPCSPMLSVFDVLDVYDCGYDAWSYLASRLVNCELLTVTYKRFSSL